MTPPRAPRSRSGARILALGLASALFLFFGWTANAGNDEGDVATGAGAVMAGPVAAARCIRCHGTASQSFGAVPAIAGRPQALIAERLRAFRSGDAGGAGTMPRIARSLSDDDIESVSRYFSQMR